MDVLEKVIDVDDTEFCTQDVSASHVVETTYSKKAENVPQDNEKKSMTGYQIKENAKSTTKQPREFDELSLKQNNSQTKDATDEKNSHDTIRCISNQENAKSYENNGNNPDDRKIINIKKSEDAISCTSNEANAIIHKHNEDESSKTLLTSTTGTVNKKPSRVIKKKKPFSPQIDKKRVRCVEKNNPQKNVSSGTKLSQKSKKQTDKKWPYPKDIPDEECLRMINDFRKKNLHTIDESQNMGLSDEVEDLKLQDKVKLENPTKLAFTDLNRHKKKIALMKLLNIEDIAIESSLNREYLIQIQDIKNLTDPILEVAETDLNLLENHFSSEAYNCMIEAVEAKRKLKWRCLKCNEEGIQKSYVVCLSCLRRFHYKCVNIKAKPKGDWFCSERTCKLPVDIIN